MTVFTYSEARQKLASLLDRANDEGEVRIMRKDGQVFVIKPLRESGFPLDVEGVELNLTANEIVEFVREGRRR